jgi:hypothetical protein
MAFDFGTAVIDVPGVGILGISRGFDHHFSEVEP